MVRIIGGIFVILHGLVHIWYTTLSLNLVEYQQEMGWSGRSWIFSNLLGDSTTRSLASGLYVIAAILFIISGFGIFTRADWLRSVLISSATISSVIILLFWDGGMQMLVQKGLIGLVINIGLIIIALSAIQ